MYNYIAILDRFFFVQQPVVTTSSYEIASVCVVTCN